MKKHIETIKGFKKGTKSIFSELRYEFLDSCEELWSALKGFSKSIFVVSVWLFSLSLVVFALPLATWLRIKWEREMVEAHKKAAQELANRMSPVERGE